MNRPSIFKSEKIWLAAIPVIGAIIIAFIQVQKNITKNESNRNVKTISDTIVKNVNESNRKALYLKIEAGKINQMVTHGNYYDLLPLLSIAIKPFLTKDRFTIVHKYVESRVGKFDCPIDTTQNIMNGTEYFYIKNQHLNGESLTTIAFDDHNHIFALYYVDLPK
jgi:hypothetical protein